MKINEKEAGDDPFLKSNHHYRAYFCNGIELQFFRFWDQNYYFLTIRIRPRDADPIGTTIKQLPVSLLVVNTKVDPVSFVKFDELFYDLISSL